MFFPKNRYLGMWNGKMPMWLVVPLNDCHTFVPFTVFSFCTNAGKRREEGRIHTRLVIFFFLFTSFHLWKKCRFCHNWKTHQQRSDERTDKWPLCFGFLCLSFFQTQNLSLFIINFEFFWSISGRWVFLENFWHNVQKLAIFEVNLGHNFL